MKKKIYVVDDEDINLEILQSILEESYDVTCYSKPQECLNDFENSPADIVLLDVDMPELDGLETCRRLIQMVPECPVVFVSGKVSDEDRLAGYDAGGYDYFSKPYNAQELLKKISLIVNALEKRATLDSEKQGITSAFMDAITGNGEQGVILHFASSVFDVKTYSALAKAVADVARNFDLSASILVGGNQDVEFYSTNGECSPIESNTLELLRNKSRIYDFNGRFQFNEKNVSMLVKNMPEDENISGRYKDHILLLLQIASSCVNSIDANYSNNILIEQMKEVSQGLSMAEKSLRARVFYTLSVINDEIHRIENDIQYLALSEDQEERLTKSLEKALVSANQSSEETAVECDELTAIVKRISQTL